MTQPVLEVFYDGACSVCRREMEHYRQRDSQGRLHLVDIAAAGFDASAYGIEQAEFMARLHVRDAKGAFHTGVDAFARIWETVPGPGWSLLARLVQLPGVHAVAGVGYALFARYRVYLPKTAECDDDHCRLHRRPPEDGVS